MINIEDLKKNLLEYDLYWLLDAVKYGDYYLTIINENDSIIIHIEDVEGFATGAISKDTFLDMVTILELEEYINAILYYNYVEYDQ